MLSLNNISETFLDFPDGESLSVIAFFNGCIHDCPGCQNPKLQIYDKNTSLSVEDAYELIKDRCNRNKTNKVVLSGGDPFFIPNDIIRLITLLENKGFITCVYTGYTIDKVKDFYIKSDCVNSRYPSYVKCGVFAQNQVDNAMGKHDDKFILASKNQAFYARIFKSNREDFIQISRGHILYFEDLKD